MNFNNFLKLSLLICVLYSCQSPQVIQKAEVDFPHDGIKFSCSEEKLNVIEQDMSKYLSELKISSELIVKSKRGTELFYTLNTPKDDTNTLDLYKRSIYEIKEDVLLMINEDKARKIKAKSVLTVSQKEILLALMQHGRTTEFANEHCKVADLRDHVGVRQNIVAWTEKLSWVWPDGTPAFWNKKYWKKGTPNSKAPLHLIINDMFYNQEKYSIGCYTATKMVIIQGVLDYYYRIKKDFKKLAEIEKILLSDKEPLVDIEPGIMWSFEKDHDIKENERAGKLLKITYKIAPRNVIPGEWIYLWNTDAKTYEHTGYEGSNAIYLGRNKLDDYYNDHNHYFFFEEKLDEVWQWRNEVYSRSRHTSRIKPLTYSELQNLYNTPENGGILFDFRVSTYLF